MAFEHISDPEHILNSPQVPANVREYASMHHVGMPLMLFPHSRLWPLSLIGRALWVVGLLGALGYIIKVYIDGVILDRADPLPVTNYYEQAFQHTQQETLWLTLGTALITIIFTIDLLLYYRDYQQKLYLCQDGLLRLGRKKAEAIRWDEVANVFGSSDALQVLHRKDKEKFVISKSWPHNTKSNRRIAHAVMEHLLPPMIERFEQGMPLSFGPLLVVRNGISSGGKVISWPDIEDVKEKNGQLALKIQEKWHYYTPLSTPLIMALVKYIARSRLLAVLTTHATRS